MLPAPWTALSWSRTGVNVPHLDIKNLPATIVALCVHMSLNPQKLFEAQVESCPPQLQAARSATCFSLICTENASANNLCIWRSRNYYGTTYTSASDFTWEVFFAPQSSDCSSLAGGSSGHHGNEMIASVFAITQKGFVFSISIRSTNEGSTECCLKHFL